MTLPTYSDFQPELQNLAYRSGNVNDVKDFGAVLDGVTDDTEAIQRAFAASAVDRRPVYISGLALITDTIEIPNVTGFTVRGNGGHSLINLNQALRGHSSGLIWGRTGTDGGTMVQSKASEVIWDSVPLYGHEFSNPPANPAYNAAGIKFLISQDSTVVETGIGTGKTTFINWYDEGPGVAVQAGIDDTVKNCDVVSFVGNTHFRGDDVGFKVMNVAGMGFCFQQVFATCPTVFEFVKGGGLDVQSVIMTSDDTTAMLKLTGPEKNNGHYRFGTIKRDAQVTGVKIVEMTSGTAQAQIDIGHLHLGKKGTLTYDENLFDLKGRTSLNLRGCNDLDKNAFLLEDSTWGSPNVFVERSHLSLDLTGTPAEELVDSSSTAPYLLEAHECFDGNWDKIGFFAES